MREGCACGREARRRRFGERSRTVTSQCPCFRISDISVATYSRGRPRRCEAVHRVVVEDIVIRRRCFLRRGLWYTHLLYVRWNMVSRGKSVSMGIAAVLCYMLPAPAGFRSAHAGEE
jgi:hypothetical protein